MRAFFKFFLAALLALFVFCIIGFFFFIGMASSAISNTAAKITAKSVLTIDLGNKYHEQPKKDFQSIIKSEAFEEQPGLYELIRLIKKAKDDNNIEGILLKADANNNGFASGEEIRMALQDFKSSKKFVIASGDMMTQKAYSVANVSDKIYVSPKGSFEWVGYSINYIFLKGTLDKLEIKPQIFYAGKFKSATEPFRAEKMTDANKLQTTVWMNDLYSNFLRQTSEMRKVDTANLRQLADAGTIQTPQDAVTHQLIDAVKYDDEIKDEIKSKLKLDSSQKINFVSIEKYAVANKELSVPGDNIALIYATGDIVDGKGEDGNIGSITYIDLLRKARLDKGIKAIVVRVNSGGGSALASENIWREMFLAKKEKPLIVSFGDMAASGGYYISCAADSIFALPNTITGSIGVFGIIPDMSAFFKNKLGVTFDGVKTGPLANAGNIDHPMNDQEQKIIKVSIERIYDGFKQRVADGRKKDTAYVETIAQGRVWTGIRAKEVGLIDAFGGLQAAIDAAAAKAKLKDYQVQEYPKPSSLFERILGIKKEDNTAAKIKSELGPEYYTVYKQLKLVKEICNSAQARLPFEFVIK